GAGLKVVPAGALDGDGVVLGVNSFFWHSSILWLILLPICAFRVAVRLRTVGSRHIECLSRLPGRSRFGRLRALFPVYLIILDSHRGQFDSGAAILGYGHD